MILSRQRIVAVLGIVLLRHGVAAAAVDPVKLLILRKDSPIYVQVATDLKKALGPGYDSEDIVVSKTTSLEDVAPKIAAAHPTLLVLMDNQAVDIATQYNSQQPQDASRLPGVALMALNLRKILHTNKYIAGIAFELPAYTLVTQFRYLVRKTIKNVTVFYRKSEFTGTIVAATEQLHTEGIALQAIDLEEAGAAPDDVIHSLREHLKDLGAGRLHTDAVWVLLDSVLFRGDLFQSTWIPAARASRVPFLSGTENFVEKGADFAVFAITPDLPDLAAQAATLVDTIVRDGKAPQALGTEETVSVNKIMNLDLAEKLKLQLRQDRLDEVRLAE